MLALEPLSALYTVTSKQACPALTCSSLSIVFDDLKRGDEPSSIHMVHYEEVWRQRDEPLLSTELDGGNLERGKPRA